jgi:hypothetical protein
MELVTVLARWPQMPGFLAPAGLNEPQNAVSAALCRLLSHSPRTDSIAGELVVPMAAVAGAAPKQQSTASHCP